MALAPTGRGTPGSGWWGVLLLGLLCRGSLLAQPAQAADRADPELTIEQWNGLPAVTGRLIVSWAADVDPERRELLASDRGTSLQSSLPGGRSLLSSEDDATLAQLLERFSGVPELTAVQPDLLLAAVSAPNDPLWPQQWSLAVLAADQAFALEGGDPTSVLAVLDSGIDLDHPDLQPKLAWGLDTYAGDPIPADTTGHGSHVAGIAAAATDNGLGMAGAAGSCRLAIYRCGNDLFPTSALLIAIEHARQAGASVLSLSFGSPFDNPVLHQALSAAADQGCVIVAAAGNLGDSAPFYPAAWDQVLGVASSDPFDQRSAFSSYGPWVDLAAPGQSILSCWKNGDYATLSGSSMACPLVAGSAALLSARLGGKRSPAHAALVRAALLESALPVGNWVAHGRLDPVAAILTLDQLLDAAGPLIEAPASLAAGQTLGIDCHATPGAHAALLLSLSGNTLPFSGQPVLANALLLDLGTLPPSGWLPLAGQLPADAAGLTLWLQLLARPAGVALALSPVISVSVTP